MKEITPQLILAIVLVLVIIGNVFLSIANLIVGNGLLGINQLLVAIWMSLFLSK